MIRKREGRCCKLRTATLNIGTLTGKGKEAAAVMVARKINILCCKNWGGLGGNLEGKPGPLVIDASYTIAVKKARNGVGICLSEYWQDKVIAVERSQTGLYT